MLIRRRDRCAPLLNNHNFLLEWGRGQLADRLDDIRRDFKTIVQIGARGGSVVHGTACITDIAGKTLETCAGPKIVSDEEFLPFRDSSVDLVISNLSLHSTNDLPGALAQIKKSLKPDGLFLACMIGGESLHELRASLMQAEIRLKGGASPRVFPFAGRQQAGALMQRAGFALPVVDCEKITVTYPDMFKLMHDLRGMGESNIIADRNKKNPGKKYFYDAAEYYAHHYGEPDGRIRATFEIIFMIGWAPHESQQKPLRPGSATHRLADILNADEIGAGETVRP